MTGYQSKKKNAQIRWIGPYAPTDRHADDITLNHVIALRRENEMLQDALRQATQELANACLRNMALKKGIQDIMDFYYTQDPSSLNNIETILRLRGAIDAMKETP
jgi:hypothetical protein